MTLVLPRRSVNFDFIRDGRASGDNYPDELSKLDPLLSFVRSSPASRFNASGTLETVSAGQPRFDFDPVTLTPKGLLIEEARTNLITRSNEFSHANWTKNSLTLNSSAIPAFGTTAHEYVSTGLDGYVYNIFSAAAATYTGSVWLRVPTGTATITLNLFSFALAANVATVTPTLTTTWQRISVTALLAAGSHALIVGSFNTWSTGKVIQMALSQCEQGTFASSYIPTSSSAETRTAENLSTTQLVPWYSGSTQTIISEILAAPVVANYQVAFSFFAGFGDRVEGYNSYFEVVAGSVQQLAFPTGFTPATVNKIGASMSSGRIASSFNGSTPSVVTGKSFPSGVSTLRLGYNHGGLFLNGHLRRFLYMPHAVSDTLLKAMTT